MCVVIATNCDILEKNRADICKFVNKQKKNIQQMIEIIDVNSMEFIYYYA